MEVINTTTTTNPVNMYDYLNNLILNPTVFIIIFLIIVAYLVFSSSLGNDAISLGNNDSNGGTSIIGVLVIAILIILILVNAFQYFFSINVSAYVNGLFTPKTQVDIVVDQTSYQPSTVPEIKFRKQVFNIPGNYYNYENSKAICSAYGASLATYKQIEDAYNSGAEWCNYGWSEGQAIYFPTQKSTWQELQKNESTKHSCGRPGINGGYIDNSKARFGVNCFGKKPKPSSAELKEISSAKSVPKTPEDALLEKKIEFWNANKDKLLKVNSYNNNKWSAY